MSATLDYIGVNLDSSNQEKSMIWWSIMEITGAISGVLYLSLILKESSRVTAVFGPGRHKSTARMCHSALVAPIEAL
jgi:hypothetical protein